MGFSGKDRETRDTMDELGMLAHTAGTEVAAEIYQRKASLHPGNFLSRGKIEEARDAIAEFEADFLICDEDLSPAQVRNLEEALKVRVIDRSELILDIFAQRAQTREARIQVELAQLRYLLPRLAGMWAHFSRTGGGIGTRGPGETQLEVDRRAVRQKISVLETRLEKVEQERRTQAARRENSYRVSLVGYTNAGKSTLFNLLTKSNVLAEDKLFATLDTTTRKLFLEKQLSILLSDTVGFIRKLPHHLVASFRATLREVEAADLIIHLVDGSHSSYRRQIEAVEGVLETLLDREIPQLLVFNKMDLVTEPEQELERKISFPDAFLMSAFREDDRTRLKARIAEMNRSFRTLVRVECSPTRLSELKALTYRGEARSEQYLGESVWSELWLDRTDVRRVKRAGFRVETTS